jgi:plastocyanin
VDGQQYVAVLAGGARVPYNSPQGDDLWGFRLDGKVPPAPTPPPPSTRQPITAPPVEGAAVGNTVQIARMWSNNHVGKEESNQQNAMAPQSLGVPVGTAVTFTNPAGNTKPHCVTQFYEGLFASPPLQPGESFTYTFTKSGEYYYNDCASPPTTGRIIVYDGPVHPAIALPQMPVSRAPAPTKSDVKHDSAMPPLASMGHTGLPPGKDRDFVQATCSGCHDVARVAGQRHTRHDWLIIIDQMRANGLVLDASARKKVADYLTTALGQ